MSWTKLDDNWRDHPKVLAAGPLGELLWLHAIGYANQYGTDGYVPQAALRSLCRGFESRGKQALADALRAGLLEPAADGGVTVHNFLTYQLSREEVEARREATRTGKVRGGKIRAATAVREAGRFAPSPQFDDQLETSSAAGPFTSSTPAQDLVLAHQLDQLGTSPVPSRPVGLSSSFEGPERETSSTERPGDFDDDPDEAVLVAHRETTGRADERLTPEKRAVIRARRREGFSQADLLAAVQGWQHDAWAKRRQNNDLVILLRDGSQVEKFRDLHRDAEQRAVALQTIAESHPNGNGHQQPEMAECGRHGADRICDECRRLGALG